MPADGRYRAEFTVAVGDNGPADRAAMHLDVFANAPQAMLLAERSVARPLAGECSFALDFDAQRGQRLEFRVYWHGNHDVTVRRVSLEPLFEQEA